MGWIARAYAAIVGTLTAAFVGAQLVAELVGDGDPYQIVEPTVAEQLALTCLAIAGVGLLVGIWRASLGATMSITGAVLSLLMGPVAGPVSLFIMLGGLLFLVVWLGERRGTRTYPRD